MCHYRLMKVRIVTLVIISGSEILAASLQILDTNKLPRNRSLRGMEDVCSRFWEPSHGCGGNRYGEILGTLVLVPFAPVMSHIMVFRIVASCGTCFVCLLQGKQGSRWKSDGFSFCFDLVVLWRTVSMYNVCVNHTGAC